MSDNNTINIENVLRCVPEAIRCNEKNIIQYQLMAFWHWSITTSNFHPNLWCHMASTDYGKYFLINPFHSNCYKQSKLPNKLKTILEEQEKKQIKSIWAMLGLRYKTLLMATYLFNMPFPHLQHTQVVICLRMVVVGGQCQTERLISQIGVTKALQQKYPALPKILQCAKVMQFYFKLCEGSEIWWPTQQHNCPGAISSILHKILWW